MHFVWTFTEKMPDAPDTTSIEHQPLTVTVRTHQGGHTVWGKIDLSQIGTSEFVFHLLSGFPNIALSGAFGSSGPALGFFC